MGVLGVGPSGSLVSLGSGLGRGWTFRLTRVKLECQILSQLGVSLELESGLGLELGLGLGWGLVLELGSQVCYEKMLRLQLRLRLRLLLLPPSRFQFQLRLYAFSSCYSHCIVNIPPYPPYS